MNCFSNTNEIYISLPSISHKNAAVAGPPHRNACQRKSRIGSMTAHKGDSITGNVSAQNADSMFKPLEFLFIYESNSYEKRIEIFKMRYGK